MKFKNLEKGIYKIVSETDVEIGEVHSFNNEYKAVGNINGKSITIFGNTPKEAYQNFRFIFNKKGCKEPVAKSPKEQIEELNKICDDFANKFQEVNSLR